MALKLLEESDPELAKRFREELEKQQEQKQKPSWRVAVDPSIIPPRFAVKKGGLTLPQVWPLSIDKSFWEDWAFVKWQALRRNPRYQREVRKLYRLSPEIFQSAEVKHLFQNYNPSPHRSENPLHAWRMETVSKSVRMKTSEQMEREVTERLLAQCFTTKGLNFWPVSPQFCFPHPHFLDKLRPLPFAIPVEPMNSKNKTPPYSVLAETGLHRPRYLRLDVSLSKDELLRKVSDYLKGLRAIQREKNRAAAQLKGNCSKSPEASPAARDIHTHRQYPISICGIRPEKNKSNDISGDRRGLMGTLYRYLARQG